MLTECKVKKSFHYSSNFIWEKCIPDAKKVDFGLIFVIKRNIKEQNSTELKGKWCSHYINT